MKKETVGRYASIFGWSVAIMTLSWVIPRVAPYVATLASGWLMMLLPFAYFFFSWGAELIIRKLCPINLTSKTWWGLINFLASLLSPLVVAVWLVAMIIINLGLGVSLVVASLLTTKAEFELLRKGKDKDQEFIKTFEAAFRKVFPKQEIEFVGEEGDGCSHVYLEERDTFKIIISNAGGVTRKEAYGLRTFAENSGYIVIGVRIFK